MISKEKGELFIECEDCGHREYGGTEEDFIKFWYSMKDQGWKARKILLPKEMWEHYCPSCVS